MPSASSENNSNIIIGSLNIDLSGPGAKLQEQWIPGHVTVLRRNLDQNSEEVIADSEEDNIVWVFLKACHLRPLVDFRAFKVNQRKLLLYLQIRRKMRRKCGYTSLFFTPDI